jgi:hypothetical protein
MGFEPIVPDKILESRDTEKFAIRMKEIYEFLRSEIYIA